MVPTLASSHGPDRIGTMEWIELGDVVLFPCDGNDILPNLDRRFFIVPRLMASSFSVAPSPWSHMPSRRRTATYSAMSGWMFSPHGSPAIFQTSLRAAVTSGPYVVLGPRRWFADASRICVR